jgi:hypothetical protein
MHRGTFRSVTDLTKIRAVIDGWNDHPHPSS